MPGRKPIRPGERFARLTVLSGAGRKNGRYLCNCLCSCGSTVTTSEHDLRANHTTSCGCSQRDKFRAIITKHGHSGTATYRTWIMMRNRCLNERTPDYKNYGQRGITICERWDSYVEFLADMGERPSVKHSIDRIDVNGNYSPANCRWATHAEQMRNTRANRLVSLRGTTVRLIDACERFGIEPRLAHSRLALGWEVHDALTRPVRKMKNNRPRTTI